MALRLRKVVLLTTAFPLAAFLSVKLGLLPAAWLGVPDVLFCGALALGLCAGGGPGARLAAVAGLALALAVLGRWPERTVTLVPVAMNLLVAGLFQRTLRPGSEPLISRIARLARNEARLAPELAAYTRHSTMAWVALFIALAVNGLLLARFATVETAMLFANTWNLGLVALFFGAEAIYRSRRYGHYWHPSIGQVVATLLKHGWRGHDCDVSANAESPSR